MEAYNKLLLNNKAWVEDKLQLGEDYFSEMALEQNPTFLWIGCSDSRVPAEDVTGAQPGELFVHRNIANMVIHTDYSMLSVLQFSVEVLKVKHVIVCGHYGCGGVKAAMSKSDFGLINNWLRHIKDVYRLHATQLDAIVDVTERQDKLVELNVIEQVQHLADISFVQRTWEDHQRPVLHGWVYDMRTGYLNNLIKVDPGEHSHDVYRYDFLT
ncbi:MAG: carbonic anhydrase [Ignavibacteria bacterium]|nr:carbonic anhydrase [Ignavibacteria bacterium]